MDSKRQRDKQYARMKGYNIKDVLVVWKEKEEGRGKAQDQRGRGQGEARQTDRLHQHEHQQVRKANR